MEAFPSPAEVQAQLMVKLAEVDEWQECTARLTSSSIELDGIEADTPRVHIASPAQRASDEHGDDVFAVLDEYRGGMVWSRRPES